MLTRSKIKDITSTLSTFLRCTADTAMTVVYTRNRFNQYCQQVWKKQRETAQPVQLVLPPHDPKQPQPTRWRVVQDKIRLGQRQIAKWASGDAALSSRQVTSVLTFGSHGSSRES